MASSSPILEYLAEKLGGPEQVAEIHGRLEAAAEGLGIDFCWSLMRRANAFDAHRLLSWALHNTGAQTQRLLKEAVLRAYFTEGLDITDHEVLAGLAADVGLDRASAVALLDSEVEAEYVRAERETARESGVTAVPTFVVEGHWMLQGAVGIDQWTEALWQMAETIS